jgi:hypothetical protein
MVLGQLRWLRAALNGTGLGFAFDATEIEEARRHMEARVTGAALPAEPPAAAERAGFIRAVRSLVEACRAGSVSRTLGSQYLR